MKRFGLNILLTLFRWLVLLKRALIRSFFLVGRSLRPSFVFFGKIFVLPVYALVVKVLRRFTRARATKVSVREMMGFDRLPMVLAVVMIGVLFIGDSRVFAGEPSRGDVLLVAMFPQNTHGERVIGQYVDDEELEELVAPSAEELPFGGTVAGGRAIVAPSTLPGAPEEGERRSTSNYVVKPGDTIGAIAERFGVSVETVLWENGLSSRSRIRPGDILKILPTTGVKHTVKKGDTLNKIANKYDVEIDKILATNRLDPESKIAIGESLLIPDGRPIRRAVPVSRRSSFAVRAPVAVPSASDSGTELLWPTSGRVITQYYHGRHSGLDVDGHYDSPIYASEGGVVATAGWNRGGYGNYIIIDHGGGLKTLYAHASKMFVVKGQRVSRGEVIAMVGTTGRSTGTHLHYEVRVGNRRMNPLRYTR
ncbi:MAG: hypothetical protein CMI52_05140 [Parcubacteria group bacterium]|nr:hypothetical protein [Parcubacteria group bacterium]